MIQKHPGSNFDVFSTAIRLCTPTYPRVVPRTSVSSFEGIPRRLCTFTRHASPNPRSRMHDYQSRTSRRRFTSTGAIYAPSPPLGKSSSMLSCIFCITSDCDVDFDRFFAPPPPTSVLSRSPARVLAAMDDFDDFHLSNWGRLRPATDRVYLVCVHQGRYQGKSERNILLVYTYMYIVCRVYRVRHAAVSGQATAGQP